MTCRKDCCSWVELACCFSSDDDASGHVCTYCTYYCSDLIWYRHQSIFVLKPRFKFEKLSKSLTARFSKDKLISTTMLILRPSLWSGVPMRVWQLTRLLLPLGIWNAGRRLMINLNNLWSLNYTALQCEVGAHKDDPNIDSWSALVPYQQLTKQLCRRSDWITSIHLTWLFLHMVRSLTIILALL